MLLGLREPLKNSGSHINASHSRQPLIKGERLVRYEVNAVMKLKSCNRFMQRWSGLQSCFPEPSNALCKSPDLSLPLILSPFNKAVKRFCHCHCLSLPLPLLLRDCRAPCNLCFSRGKIVTPKGVLLLALCHASATREGP